MEYVGNLARDCATKARYHFLRTLVWDWITEFRKETDVDPHIAGYRWICPAWNGRKRISMNWPNKFLRLFDRKKVTMIGLCENGPEPEPHYLSPKLPLRFWHESPGPSH